MEPLHRSTGRKQFGPQPSSTNSPNSSTKSNEADRLPLNSPCRQPGASQSKSSQAPAPCVKSNASSLNTTSVDSGRLKATRGRTLQQALKGYTRQDAERICLEPVRIHQCGGYYVCALPKGHETGTDVRLRKHQAACRLHHCCIISWNPSVPISENRNSTSRPLNTSPADVISAPPHDIPTRSL